MRSLISFRRTRKPVGLERSVLLMLFSIATTAQRIRRKDRKMVDKKMRRKMPSIFLSHIFVSDCPRPLPLGRKESEAQIAYFNASDRLHFFQAGASWQPPGPVVARGDKPAKNHKKDADCRKKRLHFGDDLGVLCRRMNACIGCNGPTHSRFLLSGLSKAEMCYLDLNHAR